MKLAAGIALLRYGGRWTEAITDELARETGQFIGWLLNPEHDHIVSRAKLPKEGVRIYAFKKPMRNRMAVFVDANGRRWAQRDETRQQGVNMVVKVTVTDAGVEIRNKDGSFKQLAPLSSPLIARLRGSNVAYFNATIEKDVVEIDDRVSGESW